MKITFHNVTKRFGTTEAIRNLTLSLPSHGTVAIMGPSGCGKTTILQLLAGLSHPSQGKVSCSTNDIAYVFQEPRLLPWRTVADNIRLAHGKHNRTPSKTPEEWLDAMGLNGCEARYPEELSGGMRQRVAIARALYCESELLLMDEPFRGLDEATRKHVLSLVRQARTGENKLTILVTHDRAEAMALADTVLTFTSAPASEYHIESIENEH